MVGATSFVVTSVPNGMQEYAVASYSEPGPVSSQLARVTVNVADPKTNRYRVVATGFRVVKETVDDQLDRDGLRNEVYAAFSMFHFKRGGEYELLDQDLRRTRVHGDVLKHPDRIRAGSASGTGGLRDGDAFPSDPSIRVGPVGDQSFPFSVWEGTLTDGADFEIIVPSLWEWSGSPASYDYWFASLLANAPAMWSVSGEGQNADKIMTVGIPSMSGPSQSGVDAFFSKLASGFAAISLGALDFSARDRPIGISGASVLPSGALILSRRGIEGSLAASGSTRVALTMKFIDDPSQPKLRGDYVLYLQVERMP